MTTSTRTPFGFEVGNDEIRWWISKCEPNIKELDIETRKTIISVEKIICAIKEFDGTLVTGYNSLITSLENLMDLVSSEIRALLDYVLLLRNRDLLAPSMLLAQKIWHASPLSDRRISVNSKDFDSEPEKTQQRIIECVYGIGLARGTNYHRLESVRVAADQGIPLDRAEVLGATVGVQNEVIYYFRSLRSCLENILDEIQSDHDIGLTAQSADFWREFVKRSASSNKVEPELWDFKETLDYWRVDPRELENAKFKFAADVASFANNKGGALIVGVTDGPIRQIQGLHYSGKDLENKIKSIAQVLGVYLGQVKMTYEICQVDIEGKFCIIIVIAQSREVISIRNQKGLYMYPFRRVAEIDAAKQEDILATKTSIARDNYQFIHILHSRVLS